MASGNFPTGELIRSGNCMYGMTLQGGTNNLGVVFKYCDVSLPIELISFNAEYIDEKVYIKWITATEANNDYFTIEHSTDGMNWEIAGIVNGAGNSSVICNYEFIDKFEVLKPKLFFYYRIKQTDFDGKYSYSNTVLLKVTDTWDVTTNLEVYPNPVNVMDNETLSLTLSGLQKESRVLVLLNDILGKEYYSKTVLSETNGKCNIVVESNVPFPTGLYVIRAATNNKLFSKKLMLK